MTASVFLVGVMASACALADMNEAPERTVLAVADTTGQLPSTPVNMEESILLLPLIPGRNKLSDTTGLVYSEITITAGNGRRTFL